MANANYLSAILASIILIATCSIYISTNATWNTFKQTTKRAASGLRRNIDTIALVHEINTTTQLSRNAYMLYATDSTTACNAIIMANNIRHQGTPFSIDIVVLVANTVQQSIQDAMSNQGLVVVPVEPWYQVNAPHPTWQASLTKLRIFEEHGYDRIIFIDSDAWLHRNLDHLFDLREAVFWAPRAYYQDQPFIASTLLVVKPSNFLFQQLVDAIHEHPNEEWYDMDVLNAVWKDQYGMLPNHYVVLNAHLNSDKTFGFTSAQERINKTYIHHFSEMPNGRYGKPWTFGRNIGDRNPVWNPMFYELFEKYWESYDKLCSWRSISMFYGESCFVAIEFHLNPSRLGNARESSPRVNNIVQHVQLQEANSSANLTEQSSLNATDIVSLPDEIESIPLTPETTVATTTNPPTQSSEKWAYMLYATDYITACNALIMAKNIRLLGTPKSIDVTVLVTAFMSDITKHKLSQEGLVVITVELWQQRNAPHDTWIDSLTKLRIFEERGYDKVIYIDSDAWLHRNLDQLFQLPDAVFWAPRAYYQDQPSVASTLLVFKPSNYNFQKMLAAVQEHSTEEWYDMDVLNIVWKNQYGMLPNHFVFLNSELNSDRTFEFESVEARINATYIHHFSMMDNGKYGKPWRMNRYNIIRKPEWSPMFYRLFDLYWESKDKYCSNPVVYIDDMCHLLFGHPRTHSGTQMRFFVFFVALLIAVAVVADPPERDDDPRLQKIRILRNEALKLKDNRSYGKSVKKLDKAIRQLRDLHESRTDVKKRTADAALLGQTMTELGNVLALDQRYQDAERVLKQAVDLNLKVLGDSHPSYSLSLRNLAEVYMALDKYDEAISSYKTLKFHAQQGLGQQHSAVIDASRRMGESFEKIGKTKKAIKVYKTILKQLDLPTPESSGPIMSEPGVGEIYMGLAGCLLKVNKLDEAIVYGERAEHIFRIRDGENSMTYAFSQNVLAGIYTHKGEEDIALDYLENAQRIAVREYGLTHDIVKAGQKNIEQLIDRIEERKQLRKKKQEQAKEQGKEEAKEEQSQDEKTEL
ncbi:secreted RxLR effector peptide protein [Thraustotheca clavata]|uniref:Secreted RxLR effector peptide protein n=1 Tax=Thraustotheca clavata TaxID=74557 RepID=A0A1W0A6P6_9STRA|nr:secreted RxLR effector peptide protein [Thraustotheca clavata]